MSGAVRKSEYARMRSVSAESVRLWGKKGWLVLTPDGKVDVEASDARIHALRSRRGGDRSGKAEYRAAVGARRGLSAVMEDARQREAVARADMAELERDEKAGKLVLRDAVARAAKDHAVRLVDAVLSVPARVSARLALEKEPREVEQILDGELRRTIDGVEPCEFAEEAADDGDVGMGGRP